MDGVGSALCDDAARASAFGQVPALPPRASVRVCEGCPGKAELFALRQRAGFYRKMHERACEREKGLKEKVEELQAKVRLRERPLFARKSERRSSAKREGNPHETATARKNARGHPVGSPGHGRKDYSHLPVEEEWVELGEEERRCPVCGLPFEAVGGSEDSEQVEVEVRAYRRRYRRKRYRPTCRCPKRPALLTGPPAPKLIPKGRYGVSVWVAVLLDKYCFLRPTQRLLADLATHGLERSPGTVTDGLKRLAPLFEPVMDGLVSRNLAEKPWHADETRWGVFVIVKGKVGFRGWLWVFESASAVVFVLDRSRSASVPEGPFESVEEGILIVGRYAAYKALSKVKAGKLRLAFCWSHVRRDFLSVAKNWPEHETGGLEWVEAIGELFGLNARRLEVLGDPAAFAPRDAPLRAAIEAMAERRDEEWAHDGLHRAQRKALESLANHWEGLTLFVERPEVPMDNNDAERQMRGPAVGRKTFCGSAAVWAGNLAATLFSIFATLKLWNIPPRSWLTAYLEACARHGGTPPPDAASFLPWSLSEEQKAAWRQPANPP